MIDRTHDAIYQISPFPPILNIPSFTTIMIENLFSKPFITRFPFPTIFPAPTLQKGLDLLHIENDHSFSNIITFAKYLKNFVKTFLKQIFVVLLLVIPFTHKDELYIASFIIHHPY